MKKNRLLIAALAAFTVGFLGSCTPEEVVPPTPEPPIDTPELPKEEGKITFYLELDEASVKMENYTSIWLTGCMTENEKDGWGNWPTNKNALEMKNLEGTQFYYAIHTWDEAAYGGNQPEQYAVVLGYNDNATTLSDANKGLVWQDPRKSDQCLEFGYPDNASFEAPVDGLATLGKHKFSTNLPKPLPPLKDYVLQFNFNQSVPEYGIPLIFGSFNGWKTPGEGKPNVDYINEAKMTVVEGTDRKSWQFVVPEMVADIHKFNVVVEYTTITDSITWNKIDECKAADGEFTVYQADGDGWVLELDATMDFVTQLPDPSITYDYTFILENSGEAGLGENIAPGICGNLFSWTYTAMNLVDDKWTVTGNSTAIKLEFGIINMNEGGTSWVGKFKSEDGSNLSIVAPAKDATIIVTGDFSKLGIEESVATVRLA